MRLILTLTLTFGVLISNAQFKVLAEGPTFEEPEEGAAKIIQMKNGNTFFFHITKKEEISIQIYDANHKKKVEKGINGSYDKKKAFVETAFELNNDIALFVNAPEDKSPTLYRLIIDGKTGALKKEQKVASLNKVSMGQGYAMAFGGVPPPSFYIRKDEHSDNYAIAMFNSFETDRNKRIEIAHINSSHAEISKAYYQSPDEKYKYMSYADMTVFGDQKVCVLVYGYNTQATGGKESALLLGALSKGEKNISISEVVNRGKEETWFNRLGAGSITYALTRYNPVNKKIILLTSSRKKKEKGFTSYLAFISPDDHSIDYSSPIYPHAASDKSIEVFGKKAEYTGMPQNLYINDDGSFAIVYEELSIMVRQNAGNTTDIGNLAITKFDKDGGVVSSGLIAKSHRLWERALMPYYHSEADGSVQYFNKGNQYKTFVYLNGTKNSYILFNDAQSNTESVKKGKLTTIQGVSDCDAYYYGISEITPMPDRDFVFGKPDGKRDHNLALFAISDYDRTNNIYVTLKLENEKGDKGVKLVWLQP